jgi:hypothetical protein
VEIDLDLKATLGSIDSTLTAIHKWMRDTTAMPRYMPFQATAVCDSSGYAAIQLGPVAQGRRWVVHQLIVGGVDWATSAAGTALACISSVNPLRPSSALDVSVPLNVVQDQAGFPSPSLPNIAFYTRGQFVVPPLSSIWMIISGGTSGQEYTAACDFVDEPNGS